MRDKILETIKKENKGLNPIDIAKGMMSEYTADDLRTLIHELDLMCRDGLLRCTTGNNYVINDLVTGYIDEHQRGNAHVILDDGEDIFINKTNMKGAHDKDLVLVDYVDKAKKYRADSRLGW